MRTVFATPLGTFAAETDGDAVTRLHFPDHAPPDFRPDCQSSALLRQVEREVCEFLAGERKAFTIPLNPRGGDFMMKVWHELVRIGYGEIMTYGDVARAVGNPGAARAVGMACRNNPIPLLIPCHRVVGVNGKLTGFSGGGLDLKRKLIELEAGRSGLFNRSVKRDDNEKRAAIF